MYVYCVDVYQLQDRIDCDEQADCAYIRRCKVNTIESINYNNYYYGIFFAEDFVLKNSADKIPSVNFRVAKIHAEERIEQKLNGAVFGI